MGRFLDGRGDGGGPRLKGLGEFEGCTGRSLDGDRDRCGDLSLHNLGAPSGHGDGDFDGLRLGPDGKTGATSHLIDENRRRGEDDGMDEEVGGTVAWDAVEEDEGGCTAD